MPHYKCVTCRTRLRTSQPLSSSVPDLCPHCGSLLEPVDDLAEVVGFRAIAPMGFAPASPISPQERIVLRIGDLVRHRDRRRARRRLAPDSARPVDDPHAGAVALPVTYPVR